MVTDEVDLAEGGITTTATPGGNEDTEGVDVGNDEGNLVPTADTLQEARDLSEIHGHRE